MYNVLYNPPTLQNATFIPSPVKNVMDTFFQNIYESWTKIEWFAEMVPGFLNLSRTDRQLLLNLHGLDVVSYRIAWR